MGSGQEWMEEKEGCTAHLVIYTIHTSVMHEEWMNEWMKQGHLTDKLTNPWPSKSTRSSEMNLDAGNYCSSQYYCTQVWPPLMYSFIYISTESSRVSHHVGNWLANNDDRSMWALHCTSRSLVSNKPSYRVCFLIACTVDSLWATTLVSDHLP